MVAAAITLLRPGAGPPAHRIASRFGRCVIARSVSSARDSISPRRFGSTGFPRRAALWDAPGPMLNVQPSRLVFAALVASLAACANDPPYLSCSRDTPCGGETRLCLSSTSATGHTVRFCSLRCTTVAATSTECPGSAACIRLNNGDPVCIPKCSAATDCPFTGAACAALPESLGARVCGVAP